MSDIYPFLRAWIANPLRVASIVPSGRRLGRLMTSEIGPAHAPIIELGPGTGVFTQALLDRGIPQEHMILVEYGRDFATMLHQRFPYADIVCMDAADIRHLKGFDDEKSGSVVSGLPLLSMPPRKVISILRGAFRHLREDGAFYQFTYGPTCPVSKTILDRLDLQAVSIGWALANIPPAQVFRITKKSMPSPTVQPSCRMVA